MSGTLTIRGVDDGMRQALKLWAHLNNRSMEKAAPHILAPQQEHGFSIPDGRIADIAASRDMYVATRDIDPYLAVPRLKVVNPWTSAPGSG